MLMMVNFCVLFLVLLSTYCNFGFAEGTFIRKNSNKFGFSLI